MTAALEGGECPYWSTS